MPEKNEIFPSAITFLNYVRQAKAFLWRMCSSFLHFQKIDGKEVLWSTLDQYIDAYPR